MFRRRHRLALAAAACPPLTHASACCPPPAWRSKKIYTVLRSPHVNKDAREQFEVRLHQRLVDVKDLSSETVDKLMALDLPAGVDIEVRGWLCQEGALQGVAAGAWLAWAWLAWRAGGRCSTAGRVQHGWRWRLHACSRGSAARCSRAVPVLRQAGAAAWWLWCLACGLTDRLHVATAPHSPAGQALSRHPASARLWGGARCHDTAPLRPPAGWRAARCSSVHTCMAALPPAAGSCHPFPFHASSAFLVQPHLLWAAFRPACSPARTPL